MRKQADAVTATAAKIREQVHPTIKGRRRFYEEVLVRPVAPPKDSAAAAAAAGSAPLFEVTLDGRALRSPGRRLMHLESEGLAWAIAAEWDAQGGSRGINPSTMPLMSLTATWIDQTAEARGAVIANVAKYLATDTVRGTWWGLGILSSSWSITGVPDQRNRRLPWSAAGFQKGCRHTFA
jgi:chaperone required for assembly of F1-ATPase